MTASTFACITVRLASDSLPIRKHCERPKALPLLPKIVLSHCYLHYCLAIANNRLHSTFYITLTKQYCKFKSLNSTHMLHTLSTQLGPATRIEYMHSGSLRSFPFLQPFKSSHLRLICSASCCLRSCTAKDSCRHRFLLQLYFTIIHCCCCCWLLLQSKTVSA